MSVFEGTNVHTDQAKGLEVPLWRVFRVGTGMLVGMMLCLALAVTIQL